MRLIVISTIGLAFAGCTFQLSGMSPAQQDALLQCQQTTAREVQLEANVNATAIQLHRRLCAVEGSNAPASCEAPKAK